MSFPEGNGLDTLPPECWKVTVGLLLFFQYLSRRTCGCVVMRVIVPVFKERMRLLSRCDGKFQLRKTVFWKVLRSPNGSSVGFPHVSSSVAPAQPATQPFALSELTALDLCCLFQAGLSCQRCERWCSTCLLGLTVWVPHCGIRRYSTVFCFLSFILKITF